MRELALFAGAGGGILGGLLHGWRTVAAVEIEDYPRRVLLQRQADGCLPRFPIWDDVQTFDGRPWRGRVDVITGGFPCQDISAAGKGAGITGSRSGLWGHMARIIGEVRPAYAFVENSPLLVSRGLDRVLADLAEIGYDAVWTVLGADDVGAPHRRKRIWILAYPNSARLEKYRILQPALLGGSSAPRANKEPKQATRADSLCDRPQGCRQDWPAARSAGLCRGAWWDEDPADIPDPMHSGLSPEGSKQQAAGNPGADQSDADVGNTESQPERAGQCSQESGRERGGRPGDAGSGAAQSGLGRMVDELADQMEQP